MTSGTATGLLKQRMHIVSVRLSLTNFDESDFKPVSGGSVKELV